MQLNREGTFKARPVEWGVKIESGKCPQFCCQFETEYELNTDGGWNDVQPERITAWLTLRNKNGSANEINLRTLRDTLGWTDGKLSTLNDGDWSNVLAQIVTELETYNGKEQLRVRYINPEGFEGGTGGVKKADPQAIRDLDREFGPTIRATLATSSAPKTAAKPSTKPVATDTAAMMAWKKFNAEAPTDAPESDIANQWKKAFATYFPGKKRDDVTDKEWAMFMDDGFKIPVVPAGEGTVQESDIPF